MLSIWWRRGGASVSSVATCDGYWGSGDGRHCCNHRSLRDRHRKSQVLNYLKSLHTQSPGQYAFAARAFAKVVLTFMCLIVILAVADNGGKRDLPIGGAAPDGLVDSVLSKSAAAEPWPSSLLLDWRGGK
jgi:hypothetical protein